MSKQLTSKELKQCRFLRDVVEAYWDVRAILTYTAEGLNPESRLISAKAWEYCGFGSLAETARAFAGGEHSWSPTFREMVTDWLGAFICTHETGATVEIFAGEPVPEDTEVTHAVLRGVLAPFYLVPKLAFAVEKALAPVKHRLPEFGQEILSAIRAEAANRYAAIGSGANSLENDKAHVAAQREKSLKMIDAVIGDDEEAGQVAPQDQEDDWQTPKALSTEASPGKERACYRKVMRWVQDCRQRNKRLENVAWRILDERAPDRSLTEVNRPYFQDILNGYK